MITKRGRISKVNLPRSLMKMDQISHMSIVFHICLYTTIQASCVQRNFFSTVVLRCDGRIYNFTNFPSSTFPNRTTELFFIYTSIPEFQEGWVSPIENLDVLRLLDIGFNGIRVIDRSFFTHVPQLESLRLRNNDLNTMPTAALAKLMTLKYLDLFGNHIDRLEASSLLSNANITYLNLGNNIIRQIHVNSFEGLMHLENLILYDNKLTVLPPLLSKYLLKLRSVALSGYDIQCESNGISQNETSTLRSLYLDGNNIVNLTQYCLQLSSSMTILSIANNSMSYIDTLAMGNKTHDVLKSLILATNELTEVPTTLLKYLPQLVTIVLRNNRIANIFADTFQHNAHLTLLDLSHNFITACDKGAFAELSYLESLNLNYNLLVSLPEESFGSIVNFLIKLEGNQWHCNCSLYYLWLDLSKSRFFVQSFDCVSPHHFSNISFLDVPFKSLCNMNVTTITTTEILDATITTDAVSLMPSSHIHLITLGTTVLLVTSFLFCTLYIELWKRSRTSAPDNGGVSATNPAGLQLRQI